MLLFFFQAEDGIRDTSVTGVQTCALPIFHRQPLILLLEVRPAHLAGNEFGLVALRSNHVYPSSGRAATVSPTSIGADSLGRGSWKDDITYLANSSME